MEARRSMCRQTAGGDVKSLLYPVTNERDALKRVGLRPKNHHASNVKAIHDMQKARAEVAARPSTAPKPFKMPKFRDAESVVAKTLKEAPNVAAGEPSRPSTADTFMRKGDGQRKAEQRRPQTARNDTTTTPRKVKTKPAIPTRDECKELEEALMRRMEAASAQDHIRKNALDAIRGSPSKEAHLRPSSSHGITSAGAKRQQRPGTADSSPSKTSPTKGGMTIERHESYGKVPSYLLRRKEEMLEQQNVRNERMIHHPVDCPPGMRLMKPEERVATASELERVRIKLLKALSQLPFLCDTPSLKSKKEALEEKLQQVDKATAIYSRRRIFIEE